MFDKTIWADEVVIHSIRVGAAIMSHLNLFFEQFGVTPTQFNLLRIVYVRDENGEGVPAGTIGPRLLARIPDVSRMIDRLEKQGLLERVRGEGDRRVVRVRLTESGMDLVEKVHNPLIQHNVKLLSHLRAKDEELERLAAALRELANALPRAEK